MVLLAYGVCFEGPPRESEVLIRAGRVLASGSAERLQLGEAGGDGQTSQASSFLLILCLYICPHALKIC